jgi:hypothetical protein
MKENVLIIHRANSGVYYHKQQPLIDLSQFNVLMITPKEPRESFLLHGFAEIHTCDINNEERLFELAREIHERQQINRVIALSERDLLVAGKIRSYCQARGMGYDEVMKFRNKYLMKEELSKAGLRVPAFRRLSDLQAALDFFQTHPKVIIKPFLGMGSQNVFVIESLEQLQLAVAKLTGTGEDYEIEEFIEGEIFHCDSIVKDSTVLLCSVSKYLKPPLTYLTGRSLASAMVDDGTRQLLLTGFHDVVIQAFAIKNSVVHLEVFLTDKNEPVFCEIAARPGGINIIPAVEQSYSVNLQQAAICLELGQPLPEIRKTGFYSGWIIFTPPGGKIAKISHPDTFKKSWIPNFEISAKTGDIIPSSTNSGAAVAAFTIKGKSTRQLLSRIKWVENHFKLVIVKLASLGARVIL